MDSERGAKLTLGVIIHSNDARIYQMRGLLLGDFVTEVNNSGARNPGIAQS